MDVEVSYVHILGKNNQVADLLSRWSNTVDCHLKLQQFVMKPIWLPVNIGMIDIDYDIQL